MLGDRLINSLKNEFDLSEDRVEIIVFGYRLFIYSVLGYLFIGIVAYFLHTMKATLTAAITGSIFRIFSGGAHASSQKKCLFTGTIIFNVLGLIATAYYEVISFYWLNHLFWLTTIIALIIFIVYAPADTPGKPITTKVQRNKLKGISIILLIIWFIFCKFVFKGETNIHKLYLLSSTLGLLWQSITLLPVTYRWFVFK